jgi:hypothetical protein
LRRQVHAVGGADALSGRIDAGAQGVHERGARLGIAEGGMSARHLEHVVAELDPDAIQAPPDCAPGGEHPSAGQQRDDELGAGDRGCSEEAVDLPTEPAAGD